MFFGVFIASVVLAVGLATFLIDISSKKEAAKHSYFLLNSLSDDDVDPEKWGLNFPAQMDGFRSMKDSNTATFFGGSQAYSKLIRYPALIKLWDGYAFAIDFNEERSHYYSQIDQLNTKRNNKEYLNAHGLPGFKGQPGACMNCHSGWTPSLIRELGWETFNKTPYVELSKKLHAKHGEGPYQGKLGSTCADCHSPKDMSLRVTRPAFVNAMVSRGYKPDADSGIQGTHMEMRSYVCMQCHVEYYFKPGTSELTFPWSKWTKDEPLRIEMIEAYYDETKSTDQGFKGDWKHAQTGALLLKMQHPESELSSSGIHARSGVACADCHMPYKREGSMKVSEHRIESPLMHINTTCVNCHAKDEQKLVQRIQTIQMSTAATLRMTEKAILALIDDIVIAKKIILEKLPQKTSPEDQEKILSPILSQARDDHRRAQMRWDFIASENSNGFHSSGEAQRVLAQAIDFARKGQVELIAAMAKSGYKMPALTLEGSIPPAPQPIPNVEINVGNRPSESLFEIDRNVENHF